MSHRASLLFILVVSALGFVISEYLRVNLVAPGNVIDTFGQVIALPSVAFFIVSLGLLFFSKDIFNAWRIFALVSLILIIVLSWITPETADILQPTRRLVSFLLSTSFVVFSFLLIAYKSWKVRGVGK